MKIARNNRAVGITAILATGLVQLYDGLEEFREAMYMGLFFMAFFLSSVVSAIGILSHEFLWGWSLGASISLVAIAGYLLSRSVGLPHMEVEEWGPPLAYFSIFLEVLYFIPFARLSLPRLREAPC